MRLLLATIALLTCSTASAADATVEIQVILHGNTSPEVPQQWAAVLQKAGFSRTTIREKRQGDEIGITNKGSKKYPTYQVTALLSGKTLILPPNSRFKRTEVKGIARWIEQLKNDGAEVTTSPKVAFGLTLKQLEAVNEQLKTKVEDTTKGESSADIVKKLAGGLKQKVVVSSSAARALKEDGVVRDDLKGLSTGTALAAILRPAGLVLRPSSKAGEVKLEVIGSQAGSENWPIGWKSKRSPGQTMPALFERDDTQDVEVPLQAALEELSSRVGSPFLLDHNGMAVHRIDVNTKVKMQAGRKHYSTILRKILSQVQMDYEVRVDENNKPFLWITPGR
ncbi:MAG: hypothetical protein N2C12_17725 [Planctomycetales bacterium]